MKKAKVTVDLEKAWDETDDKLWEQMNTRRLKPLFDRLIIASMAKDIEFFDHEERVIKKLLSITLNNGKICFSFVNHAEDKQATKFINLIEKSYPNIAKRKYNKKAKTDNSAKVTSSGKIDKRFKKL
jgi:hypothetical protein